VKGLEKLTPIRLAEVLSQKGLVNGEAIADALYANDKHREPFTEILVTGGHITEWDLAKVVVEHFQLPFIMSGSYEVPPEVRGRLPKEVLFSNLLVPLDVFHDVMTVAMPILTAYDTIRSIQNEHKLTVYPYVGLPSENKTVLGEMFPDFREWAANSQKELEARRKRKQKKTGGDDDWMSLFDSADAAVRTGNGGPAKG
jgi:hypothetical protein